MNRLTQEIEKRIVDGVRASVLNGYGSSAELRTVFHGPPIDLMKPVFDRFASEDGITVQLRDESPISFPVLLQVDHLETGMTNPPVGLSGYCDESHLLALRNSPSCPRFVALVPPGRHRNLSVTSASNDFGLAPDNNSGSSTIEGWWADDFIQDLVSAAAARHVWNSENEKEQAIRLAERAARAADEAGRHDVSRLLAWNLLSRLFAISSTQKPFAILWSLACGFPPMSDGSISFEAQSRCLEQVADSLVDDGFKPGMEQLKSGADEEDVRVLDECLAHLQQVCDVPTAFRRATSYYYGPFQRESLGTPPGWWSYLTVEKWAELLQDDQEKPGIVTLTCSNPMVPACRGMPVVVESNVCFELTGPDGASEPFDITLTRETGGVANRQQWQRHLPNAENVIDNSPPIHKTPIRYVAESPGLRKATMRVVSLSTWEPGVIVYCRTASKIAVPKRARRGRDGVDYECAMTLSGQGRHYFDIHLSPGVSIETIARLRSDTGITNDEVDVPLAKASETSFGMEIAASAECHCDLRLTRSGNQSLLRLNITCDDTTAEGCKSEFERLIRLNRQFDRARAMSDVQIDRQVRCADLQTWILDNNNIERSYLPVVLAPDYTTRWRAPGWQSLNDTLFSSGGFLHDPRPTPAEISPPIEFIESRRLLAKKIRGEDDGGLIESAKLGEWLATEPEFAVQLENYVRSFLVWLEAEPDCAAWCDTLLVTQFEADGQTLSQEPNALIVSPMHPLKLAWHALAQRALYVAYRSNNPCPAASVLDPDSVPDVLALPVRTASGSIRRQPFISVECSSDYWTILWNGSRLDRLNGLSDQAPFDQEFGLQIGGAASGFSVSQVKRALDDVAEMLSAKPILNVVVSSASGQNNACNDGLISWCRERLASRESDETLATLGSRIIQVFDDRKANCRPEDAAISNLAEDTGNSVRWFSSLPESVKPDLGIVAQLETSNPSCDPIDIGSPIGIGALIRHRIRRQQSAGAGAFLSESRTSVSRPPSGDGLADKVATGIVRLENLGDQRTGYTFAPSVHAIDNMLQTRKADYAAVSSAVVDPACFLGNWLDNAFLWDYDLPSYSHRSGDTNGYYLLSQVKDVDRDTLKGVLAKLPGTAELTLEKIDDIILEVARRGIPTIRGLSGGDTGASGDLGLFIAARLLQDSFRLTGDTVSLHPVLTDGPDGKTIVIVVPVDPFRGYLTDLQRAIDRDQTMRPDLLVAGIRVTDSQISCRLTPVEVKYRGREAMSNSSCKDALQQASSLSALLNKMQAKASEPDLLIWKLAFQHLLISILSFGFRVYSQQKLAARQSKEWAALHQRFIQSLLTDELGLEVDSEGRLITIDASPTSVPKDIDGDEFKESISLSLNDASNLVCNFPAEFYDRVRGAVGDWRLLPQEGMKSAVRVSATVSQKDGLPISGLVESASSAVAGRGPASIQPAEEVTLPISKDLSHLEQAATPGEDQLPLSIASDVQSETVIDAGIVVKVGRTVDGFHNEMRRLNLSDTMLNQLNIGVVGDLGTGKTQLLKSLILQMIEGQVANRGIRPRVLIFDYKKDYSSPDFVSAVQAKVVKPHHLPLNLFDVTDAGESMTPWLDRFKFFSDVLDKIFSGIGPVQRQQLKQAVRGAFEACSAMGKQPTIYDVHAQYRTILGNRSDAPLSIIDDLVDMEMFSPEPPSGSGFSSFFDGVVVIALNALGQDDRSKNMLVAFMLNMFYEHMLRIPKRPYVGTDPQLRVIDSFLLVDEADNIMRYEFDVLRKILLQGREFGVGVILASQYLRHFKAGGTDYREPLLTWCIHKVPNVTPQELGTLGLTADIVQLAERVKTLPNHQCLFKTHNVAGDVVRGVPFYELITDRK